MRKNSPRKWLHATLDLLPVILIPVFMIYSHRHTIDSYSLTREEPLMLDFFQGVKNGKPTSISDWFTNDGDDFVISLYGDYIHSSSSVRTDIELGVRCELPYNENEKLYISFEYDPEKVTSLYIEGINDEITVFEEESLDAPYFYHNIVDTYNSDVVDYLLFINDNTLSSLYVKNVMIFNLSTIFGSGNEPSIDIFEHYLEKDYYNFGNNLIYDGMHNVTYNDTDIMSQFTYQLYNAVDKYFNMGNVFNLTGVYNWFIFNIMGGSSPLSLYIVWNIVLYEFIMDLLFLLYGLFMWFIDMVQHLMEKPFNSIK